MHSVPDNVLIARESASFKSEPGTVHSIPDNLRTLKKQEQSNEAFNLKSCLPVPLVFNESGPRKWCIQLVDCQS